MLKKKIYEEVYPILYQYDKVNPLRLKDIKDGDFFKVESGRKFQRICILRKYYKCLDLDDQEIYRLSPIVKVDLL